jgi:hypothetical protein
MMIGLLLGIDCELFLRTTSLDWHSERRFIKDELWENIGFGWTSEVSGATAVANLRITCLP